jgi:D-sedoheptulose 7-phosphate isomerase|tara:strand:+ start:58 stop:672 length:615 start_codon:yes stop_codon:yes gene_type:complete
MKKKLESLKSSNSIDKFAKNYFEYMAHLYSNIDLKIFKKFETEFEDVRSKEKTLFIIGNGGGASTAMSMVNDLGFDILKKTKNKKPFKMKSLIDNSIILTAISNDTSFEDVFTNQLKLYFKKGDKLLIFSASGNSKNLIRAAEYAKKNNGKILSVVGFDGGKVKKISDCCMHINTNKGEYGPVEDLQLTFNHILAHWFQIKLKK